MCRRCYFGTCAGVGCEWRPGITGMRLLCTIVPHPVSIAGGERKHASVIHLEAGRRTVVFVIELNPPPGAARIGFCDSAHRNTVFCSTACANRKSGQLTILGMRESASRLIYYYSLLLRLTEMRPTLRSGTCTPIFSIAFPEASSSQRYPATQLAGLHAPPGRTIARQQTADRPRG